MYSIYDKTLAIKTVQKYLGTNQTGSLDAADKEAIVLFQKTNNFLPTGIVDYNTFVSLRSEYKRKRTIAKARADAPLLSFPVTDGDSGDGVLALNLMLASILKEYSYFEVPPRGRYYNAYTSEAILFLKNKFGLKPTNEVDEEFYARLMRERLTRYGE